eukprot:5542832-Amphidinium_carterae.1
MEILGHVGRIPRIQWLEAAANVEGVRDCHAKIGLAYQAWQHVLLRTKDDQGRDSLHSFRIQRA